MVDRSGTTGRGRDCDKATFRRGNKAGGLAAATRATTYGAGPTAIGRSVRSFRQCPGRGRQGSSHRGKERSGHKSYGA
jgi:hypothetical protein